jgi:hypothetical protein
MDAEGGLESIRTGDILLARTAETTGKGSRIAEWTEIGVAIHPEDVGVDAAPGLFYYTMHGTLGALQATVRRLGHAEVRIAVGPGEYRSDLQPNINAAVRAALISAHVEPVDHAAETMLSAVRQQEHDVERALGQSARPADPESTVRSILDIGRRHGYTALTARLCRHHKTMPCHYKCPPGSS